MVATRGHASYARGALTALLAIAAFVGGKFVVAEVATRQCSCRPTPIECRSALPQPSDQVTHSGRVKHRSRQPTPRANRRSSRAAAGATVASQVERSPHRRPVRIGHRLKRRLLDVGLHLADGCGTGRLRTWPRQRDVAAGRSRHGERAGRCLSDCSRGDQRQRAVRDRPRAAIALIASIGWSSISTLSVRLSRASHSIHSSSTTNSATDTRHENRDAIAKPTTADAKSPSALTNAVARVVERRRILPITRDDPRRILEQFPADLERHRRDHSPRQRYAIRQRPQQPKEDHAVQHVRERIRIEKILRRAARPRRAPKREPVLHHAGRPSR